MRQHGVNRQGRKRIFCVGQLLDQTDAVDDDIGTGTLQHTDQSILVEYIDPSQQACSALLGEILQRPSTAHCAPDFIRRIVAKRSIYGTAQHAGYAQHQYAHQYRPLP
ncbi:hypothetical protein D3C80_1641310 [compost metagenome]